MFKILTTLLFSLFTLLAFGQRTVAEEPIRTDGSSATVRMWFDRIEHQTGIVLAYNPAHIDMAQRVDGGGAGVTTVAQLLRRVLADYMCRLVPMEGRKLLVLIDGPRLYDLTGMVREAATSERLGGATVMVVDGKGQRSYAMTDHNGVFHVTLPRGRARVAVSYVGYAPSEQQVDITAPRMLTLELTPVPFETKAVQVNRRKSIEELDEMAPSNLVSFSNADLFSQIRILPGVSAASANVDFSVAGGSTDENLFLLDGFPVYNPGHINSMLTLFNGDAVKSVSFYNSFIPTQYEGRLSSVTDVRLREGNKREYASTLSLDMASASVVTEGPIVKDKLSYLVSGRHSWLDFFDSYVSEENRMNHTFYDTNFKLSYDIDSLSNISLTVYNSVDDYHEPEDRKGESMLHWNNQLYALHFNTIISHKVRNATSMGYSLHSMRANPFDFLVDSAGIIRNRIRSVYANTEFTYSPGQLFTLRWGLKGVAERYDLAAMGMRHDELWEPIKQLSLFFDNRVRLTPWLYAQVGFNYVRYMPRRHRRFNSVQPRFSLKAAVGNDDLLHLSLTRMEQFFHHVRVNPIATPFDFIMPTIAGFNPSRATHLEMGWRHYTARSVLELSAYYKRRYDVLALRPLVYVSDTNWDHYLMAGDGQSYGASLYYYGNVGRWRWQLAYTLSKSREWFAALPTQGKMPATNDLPHVLNGALSFELTKAAMVTLGGNVRSGRIVYGPLFEDEADPVENFRTEREPTHYRIDASYTYRHAFARSKLLVRVGLYNIMGNPSDEDLDYFFSVRFNNQCIPYVTVSYKF